MTIDEAIKILIWWQEGRVQRAFDDVNKATQLGIEALKEIEYLHATQVLGDDELLLSETKD